MKNRIVRISDELQLESPIDRFSHMRLYGTWQWQGLRSSVIVSAAEDPDAQDKVAHVTQTCSFPGRKLHCVQHDTVSVD